MAAVLQQATRSSSNAIPRQTTGPEVLSFEKELSYELESLAKLCSRRADTALRQRLSNGLFQLWNKYEASKYETKLSPEFLAEKQLSTGDYLYQAKEYQLASVHCYGRYLRSLEGYDTDGGSDWIVEFCKTSKHTETATFALRAAIGDTASRYYHYLQENHDPHFMFPQTVSQVLSLLGQLQSCSQACLQREAHYWLAYNSVLLTYSISRRLLSTGKVSAALEPLLWASVCMESSIPLLTLKYLRLRADIYTAVCQCYFQLKEPRHAELFARRGLEKVHELALLEHQSSSAATEASERAFHEATLKLGVVVFRRSVLESRLTRKTVFRPKKRPNIKELLQQLFPRSPTEKLLVELFPGDAARFLAILEALAEPCRDPLAKGHPRPITNLDADTTADVMQELLCAGTDLALKSLRYWEDVKETQANDTPHVSLLESAINKSDVIPLASILRYVRMALSYDQREVCDLLLDRALGVAGRSPESAVARHLVCIRLLMAVEGVRGAGGKRVTLPGGAESQHALVAQEPGEKLLSLSSLLHSACQDPALQEWERDLLQDSVLFLWDTVRPAFSQLHSHHFNTTRPLTSSRRGKEYAGVLEQLVDMVDWLGLWRPHPLICGELVMKMSCLKESLASRPYRHTPSGAGEVFAGGNDRCVLLETQSLLERGLRWTHLFMSSCNGGEEDPVAMMYGELCYALTRVKVKLTATIPPPATPDPSLKPSSLIRKVRERQEKAERRDTLLSSLPTPVPSLADLKTRCGQNHYSLALLSMLEAALAPPRLTPAQRTNLLNEALSSLQHLDNEQGRPRSPPLPVSSPSPPPPLLLHQTPTSLIFTPAPWNPPHNQQVAYYRLYGRVAEGSNVKVRLSDKAFPGLGTEVSAGPNCRLKARDLKPNALYVFAVAAYSKNGELLGQQTGQLSGLSHLRMGQTSGHSSGGSIGETGCPIVSCHALPLLPAWSYLCQCAFVAGGEEVALKAARKLWNHFVETRNNVTTPAYRLKSTALTSTPSTLLHHFVYSVFIHAHLTSPPLPSSPHHRPHNKEPRHCQAQLHRLDLCHRLLVALEVCGHIREPSLCLQTVVMVHGLLSPLLQRDIATLDITRILVQCQRVWSELPERLLLSHSHLSTQAALHHTVASTAFHLAKMLLKWNKTQLLKELLTGAKALLLLTMPSTQLRNPEIGLDQSIGSQAPSLVSYVTASSGIFPGLLVPRGTGGDKKNKRGGKRKTTQAAEQIPDEAKSREYKAFEAFTATNLDVLGGQAPLDLSDITGQEDPLILHSIIATTRAVQAHREVHKFRRRPQYLEFFVHLASAGMEQGLHHLVPEWAHETFTWLARRNEIILTTRPVHVAGKPHVVSSRPRKNTLSSSHPPTTNTTTSKTTATTTHATSRTHSTKPTSAALGDSHRGKPHPPSKTTPTNSKTTPISSKALTRHSGGGGVLAVLASQGGGKTASRQGRRSKRGRASLLNERLTRLLALEGVAVTREDIVMKATSVLQSLLPELWRNHKCRKRIREVCSDELVWRAQANLLLTQCLLNQLLKKFRAEDEEEEEEEEEGRGVQTVSHSLRAGLIMEGDIPTYPPVTPGYSVTLGGTKPDPLTGEKFTRPPNPGLPRCPLEVVRELMRCLQRAVVLAGRGRQWLVLQNSCRCLWNAIHCLLSFLTSGERTDIQLSPRANREGVYISVAAVYGLASKPLYMALEAVTDLVTAYGMPLPIRQDTALEPDFLFLRRFSLLSLHTMLAQEHWEGMVSVGLRLCEGVRVGRGGREWVGEMLPIILEGQARLARRVTEHSSDLQRKAIEPAAHFDPGSEGHDIYGKTGHALARVCVPLQPQTVLDRLQMEDSLPGRGAVDEIVKMCKTLLAQYLSGPTSGGLEEDAAPPAHQLPLLITHYTEAVSQLEAVITSGEDTGQHQGTVVVVSASLLHDLGSLHLHSNNRKEAGVQWEKGLRQLLHCSDGEEPRTWWKRDEGSGGGGKDIQKCGTTGTMLAAVLAVKIARYVHANKAKASLQYLLTAASHFRSIPVSSLPHLSLPSSFLPPSSSSVSATDLPVGINLFDYPLFCDPMTSLDSLAYCSRELVERKYPLKALPVLWLYWQTAHSHCRSPPHTLVCQSLRLLALTHLHMFPEALSLLGEVLGGRGVPQVSCDCDLPSDSSDITAAAGGFSDSLPLTHTSNVKALKLLMNRELPTSVASCCGREALVHFSLARAELYIALASTSPTLPPTSVLTRGFSTGLTKPSPTPSPSATTPVPSPFLLPPPSSTKPGSRSTSERHTNLISSLLLENAERILHNSFLSLSSLSSASELRARGYLALSKLALSRHNNPAATKLSLATLRVLQSSSSSTSCHSVVHRLWLEARLSLTVSLVGKRETNGEAMLDCTAQCQEGVKEAEKFGDVELCAQFHFTAALHSLSLSPPNVEAITRHSQSCLQTLASLPYLSPPLFLLHARCTLLLCDAGCHGGHVTSHDATLVYQRLVKKLRKQIEGEGQVPCSAYHPLLPLLSSALLRLSIFTSHFTDNDGPPAGKDGPPSTKDGPPTAKDGPAAGKDDPLSMCQEGLDLLEKSVLYPDLCLKSSLISQEVTLIWRDPATERAQLTKELLLAITSFSENKVDYRKLFTSCFEVAWLLCEAIPQQEATPTDAPPTIKPKISRSVSSLAKKTSPSRSTREGSETRRVRSLPDLTRKETYNAWCAVKTAWRSLQARECLRGLTSQLHHPELSKPLSDKALGDLPEFALVELCRGGEDSTLSCLLSSSEAPPAELLLPRAQPVPATKITWFQVVSYAYSLLTRCFWPHPLTPSPNSQLPNIHTLTPSLHSQYRALASFLQYHLPVFSSSCSLPSLPPSLLPTTPPPSAKPQLYQHLGASEGEMTVVWYRPQPNSPFALHISSDKRAGLPPRNDLGSADRATLRETAVPDEVMSKSHDLNDVTSGSRDQKDDIILGLFGFNQKAVKPPPQSGPPVTPAVEVFAVSVRSGDLDQLRHTWRQLSGAAQGLLDNRLAGRPISRSASRQRKQVEKNQQVQASMQVKLAEGVKELCKALGRVANEEEELPHLEPHLLSAVLSLLSPPSLPSSLTSHGDTSHFLLHLLHTTSPAHCHTHS